MNFISLHTLGQRSFKIRSDIAHKQKGFTIVELLIVIVVIAILAAITIVAFNGIQNRASDSTAQQDLAVFHKKVALFNADYGYYPRDATDLVNNIRMPFTKSVYVLNDGNFMYCASTGGAAYMIIVRVTSTKKYSYSSETGLREYTGPSGSPSVMCNSTGFVTTSSTYGYEPSLSGWGNPGYRIWTGA